MLRDSFSALSGSHLVVKQKRKSLLNQGRFSLATQTSGKTSSVHIDTAKRKHSCGNVHCVFAFVSLCLFGPCAFAHCLQLRAQVFFIGHALRKPK